MSITAKSLIRRDAVSPHHQDDGLPGAPVTFRRQLSARQRNGSQSVTNPSHPGVVRADDLEDMPITRAPQGMKVTPLRTRCSIQPEPKSIGWVKIVILLFLAAVVVSGLIWSVLSLISWWGDVTTTYAYGPTRTSVVSSVFGINHDSLEHPTSVIAMNVEGTFVIESLPAGEVLQAKFYPTGLTLVGENATKLPVVLTIKDLNGDHKPDVLVEIAGQGVTLKLINTSNGFTLTK